MRMRIGRALFIVVCVVDNDVSVNLWIVLEEIFSLQGEKINPSHYGNLHFYH